MPLISTILIDPLIKKLIGYIESNIQNSRLVVDDLAEYVNMSRAQFFRKFKTISDVSPNRFILSIRMKLAVEHLNRNDMNLSEIAYLVGFSDPAYFTKAFKSIYGITPSEYVRNHSKHYHLRSNSR